MTAWWTTRSAREKMLLGVAALMLAIAIIWQFVLHPALQTLERAKMNHERAAQTLTRLDRIETLLQQGETILPYTTIAATQDTAALKAEAERMAREGNLSIDGAVPPGPKSFRITVSGVTGPAYFKWIEQVETGLGLSTSSAALTQNADGTMDADTEFSLDGVS
ncbi:MAG: type II secretion system protein GspM [Hyphomonas sp.]